MAVPETAVDDDDNPYVTFKGGVSAQPKKQQAPGAKWTPARGVRQLPSLLALKKVAQPAAANLSEISPVGSAAGLNANEIRLVSWNMQKKSLPNWRADYSRLTDGRDLILIQEASLRVDTIGDLPAAPHWSFAPGYRTDDSITGVLTLSRTQPLARCSFANTEPLLRTPKATSITQFALQDRDETLLVVNVHAVNFSLGLGSYKHQFKQISDVLEGHQGPIIFSGDLNTWRAGRTQTIEAMVEKLGLLAVEFSDDNRKRFFGSPLDHIYVRGLSATDSDASVVTSSDHNPMTVTLGM